MSAPRTRQWIPFVAGGLAAALVAGLGATMTDIGPWYWALNKPSWQPPDWLFGPAWTLIFALTALAGIVSWTTAPHRTTREWIIGVFALNGFLNIVWSALFFRLRHPDWALVGVALLWLSIVWLMLGPTRHSKTAQWLLVPYLGWVSFAAILNLSIVRLNGPF